MRKALNENPVVQVVMLGLLGIVVAFLFMTRVMGGDEATEPAPATTATTVPAAPATAASTPAPAPSAATAPTASGSTSTSPADAGFEAGPGLPGSIVKAHRSGDVVALLILQEEGIEDAKLKAEVEALRRRADTTVLVSSAEGLTRYSRIAEGVNLDRVPGLVVIHPPAGKRAAQTQLPVATISYGFRGPDGVRQAIADALYEGRNLPYHPG
ncbi:MAG: hypothetical protein M3383_07875 [Actinomycetota bacterium]|nr:hypothetical protein [Actinomycetota bacterium]